MLSYSRLHILYSADFETASRFHGRNHCVPLRRQAIPEGNQSRGGDGIDLEPSSSGRAALSTDAVLNKWRSKYSPPKRNDNTKPRRQTRECSIARHGAKMTDLRSCICVFRFTFILKMTQLLTLISWRLHAQRTVASKLESLLFCLQEFAVMKVRCFGAQSEWTSVQLGRESRSAQAEFRRVLFPRSPARLGSGTMPANRSSK